MNYFKSFNETRINYDLYTLNPSDSISLLEIGNKCPLYDGSVVFEARIMYGAIYGLDYQFIDICETDSTRGEKRLSQNLGENYDSEVLNSEKGAFKTLVYPNPNNGNFFINTDNFNNVQIFDLQGRIVNSTVCEIEIDANNGMYNIQIIHPNSIENVKIQVNK